MFNGYNETPLISCNEFSQERGKRQENVPKWSYGQSGGVQCHPYQRQHDFWSNKSNILTIPTPVNNTEKCSCTDCYSENSSYQGDSNRHRPWLPRTFPVPISGSNESYKLFENHHQWNGGGGGGGSGSGLPNHESCVGEGNLLHPQYFQDGKEKNTFYRQYQNARLPELNQSDVVMSSGKIANFSKKEIFLKQKDEISLNSAMQDTPYYGQIGARQPVLYNSTYGFTRNLEKRLDGKNCDSNICDFSEKYSNVDPYRHSGGATSYSIDQHVSRSPVVEPYLKAVPLNLNQNRVPSTGHRRLKENIYQTPIDESRRINNVPEECQITINENKNGRVIFQPSSLKESSLIENFQPGQFPGLSSPIDLKNSNETQIDYSQYGLNRDLTKHYENLTEAEAQKLLLDRDKSVDYFTRNGVPDLIKRYSQTSVQDTKKDCALNSFVQSKCYADQQYNNLARFRQLPNMTRYLEVNNSHPSVFYSKELNLDKNFKTDKRDYILPENPNVGSTRNNNFPTHPRLPQPNPVLKSAKIGDFRYLNKTQNPIYSQNHIIPGRTFPHSEYSCQGYKYVAGRYEYSHPINASDFQINDNNQVINQRNLSGKVLNNTNNDNQPFDNSENKTLACESFNNHQQEKNHSTPIFPEQFTSNILYRSLSNKQSGPTTKVNNSVSENKKSNYLETISSQNVSKNTGNKISPLRLLRKKKLNAEKSEVVNISSPVPSTNSEAPPSLDVRKFWSTWADGEEENVNSTQMVVLDCQNIDPEQAQLLQLYDGHSVPPLNLENGHLMTVKSTQFSGEPDSIQKDCEINFKETEKNVELAPSIVEDKTNGCVVGAKEFQENSEIFNNDNSFDKSRKNKFYIIQNHNINFLKKLF